MIFSLAYLLTTGSSPAISPYFGPIPGRGNRLTLTLKASITVKSVRPGQCKSVDLHYLPPPTPVTFQKDQRRLLFRESPGARQKVRLIKFSTLRYAFPERSSTLGRAFCLALGRAHTGQRTPPPSRESELWSAFLVLLSPKWRALNGGWARIFPRNHSSRGQMWALKFIKFPSGEEGRAADWFPRRWRKAISTFGLACILALVGRKHFVEVFRDGERIKVITSQELHFLREVCCKKRYKLSTVFFGSTVWR